MWHQRALRKGILPHSHTQVNPLSLLSVIARAHVSLVELRGTFRHAYTAWEEGDRDGWEGR
jgi:hypothetical protein